MQCSCMSDRTRKTAGKDTGAGLHETIRILTSELSLEMVLQLMAELSRRMVQAAYSPLEIVAEDGTLARFVTSGIPKAAAKRIGDPPTGKGVLGVVLREGQALRLTDLGQYPASSGFPPNHPEMHNFLGLPIAYKGRVLRDLYLTNKIRAAEFSADDENIVVLFVGQAAAAIE